MTIPRSDAINRILEGLEAFEIPLNPYYDEPDVPDVIDDNLTGMVNSLQAYCQLLGWAELLAPLQDMTPFEGNAVNGLELIKSFIIDAVEASFKEINDTMKRIVKEVDGRELDGAGLMTTALSVQNPIVRLSLLESETDRNIQQGYMQIFAGAMTGIRNPNAHGNLNPDSSKALHLISLASLLMHKIDERVE